MDKQEHAKEHIANLGMDVLQEPVCPRIDDDSQVKLMLERCYGLTVLSLKCINGYDDKNYHVVVDEKHNNPHLKSVCELGYLVKIVNHLDSKMPDYQKGQKILMDQLNASGFQCQTEIKTVEGEYFSTLKIFTDDETVCHTVSVRTYLSGDILDKTTLTPNLVYDLGVLTSDICQGLEGLDFEFYNDFTPLWSMEKFFKVKKVLHAVTDTARRQVAEEVFDAFEVVVVPRKTEFRKGMIHGDINEQNILVQESLTSGVVEICGLIDFQDSCKSYCIYDLSIATAYMMMVSKTELPLLDVGGHMLAGYEKKVQLNDAERVSFKTLIASRMVMSLVYGAYYYMLNPSNEYVLTTAHAGWNNLLEFWKTEEDVVWKRWNEIVQSYNKL